jgi:hypothetical protein
MIAKPLALTKQPAQIAASDATTVRHVMTCQQIVKKVLEPPIFPDLSDTAKREAGRFINTKR